MMYDRFYAKRCPAGMAGHFVLIHRIEMLVEYRRFLRGDLPLAGHTGGHVHICSVDHRRHRLRTEIAVKALVIPEDPEPVLLADLVGDAGAACGIF